VSQQRPLNHLLLQNFDPLELVVRHILLLHDGRLVVGRTLLYDLAMAAEQVLATVVLSLIDFTYSLVFLQDQVIASSLMVVLVGIQEANDLVAVKAL